jgi:hypothetical protein
LPRFHALQREVDALQFGCIAQGLGHVHGIHGIGGRFVARLAAMGW